MKLVQENQLFRGSGVTVEKKPEAAPKRRESPVMQIRRAEVDHVLKTQFGDATHSDWKLMQEEVSRLRRQLDDWTDNPVAAEWAALERSEHAACERSNRLAKILGDVLDVLERPGDYLDRGVERIRQIVTSEEDPREVFQASAIDAWREHARRFVATSNPEQRVLARRVVALSNAFEEAQVTLAARAWTTDELTAGEKRRAAVEFCQFRSKQGERCREASGHDGMCSLTGEETDSND